MLDEMMQHVSRGWYRFIWVLWITINLAFLAAYIISRKFPELNLETTYGLNDAVLYMSLGILAYLLTVYWLVARVSLALASFIGSLMIVLPFVNVFNETNQSVSSLVYIVAWLFTCWAVGMHGLVIALGAMLITSIYLLLEIEFDFSNLQPISMVLIFGSLAIVVLDYFFWRNRFITESSERVRKLSGQLKSHEQQLEIMVQSITDGIIATNTTGQITSMNPGASKLTGWPQSEAEGFDATAVLKLIKDPKSPAPVPDSEHPFNEVLLKHQPVNETLLLVNRGNKSSYISLAISPVILPQSNQLVGAVAVFRDVDKEKAEEQQRAEFISTASHEMRTPVAAIEGYLALALNENVSSIDSRAREYLEKAHASTQHLGKLFQDLLTSAKAEDGRLTNHPAAVEMGSFIEKLAEDLRFSAEKKNLGVEFIVNTQTTTESGAVDTSGGGKTIQPLYYVHVDPDRIREVVTNIFDNAVKYTETGHISLGLTGNKEVVQIRIADTGPGIPAEDLPHLFQKFYRVDNTTTRTIGGTGLGLFICKKIVELYNGTVWAESTLGKGSTFYINLPRVDTSRATQMQAAEKNSPPA